MAFTLIHGMFGYLFGRIFTKDTFYLNIFFLFAMLPDIDGIIFLWSPALMNQYHRVLMHSIVIGVLVSISLIPIFKNKNWVLLFCSGVFGWLSHLFLDTITTNSFIMPWFPINTQKIFGVSGNMGDPLGLVILTMFLVLLFYSIIINKFKSISHHILCTRPEQGREGII